MNHQINTLAQGSLKKDHFATREKKIVWIITVTIIISVVGIYGGIYVLQEISAKIEDKHAITKGVPSPDILDIFEDYLFDKNYILHFPSGKSLSFERGVDGLNDSPQGEFSPDGKYLAYTFGNARRGNDLAIYDIINGRSKNISGTHRLIKDLNWFRYRDKLYLLYNSFTTSVYDNIWLYIFNAEAFREVVSKMAWSFVDFLSAGEGIKYEIVKPGNKVVGQEVVKFEELLLFDVLMIPSKEAEKIIASRAKDAILAVKHKDMEKLSRFIHPDKGVRFSPCSYVNIKKDLVFSAEKIKYIFKDTAKYVWGDYDGTGFPIELTFKEYYKQFIYDQAFDNAKEIVYNKIIGRGNTLNNNFETYPGSIIVEYHFPGFDPKYEGMDWVSLRLAFEEKDGVWYLVGIIHDSWTI